MKLKIILAAAATVAFSGAAIAQPVMLTGNQMDTVAAGGNDKVDGFVCPVIQTDAVLHATNGTAIGDGYYSVVGPDVSVPAHSTNQDGDALPTGGFSTPGDSDYTAIWGAKP